MAGVRQADLARKLGISPSYLNLIEHNRRRIGGKLLLDIARALGVEPSLLTEGAEAALIAALREAARAANLSVDEVERAEELAGRFPAWAEVLASAHRRIASLERTVETLSDRLAHDPKLAASVHELLSTAASIRSTASILAEERDIEAEWRDRFHANLNQDSKRLAESSRALVTYFEAGQVDADVVSSPQDEVDAFMAHHGYHFEDLESGAVTVSEIIDQARQLGTVTARKLARAVLERTASDAEKVPLDTLAGTIDRQGKDPIALADALGVSVATILRRLAALPSLGAGLVICDRAGSILFRKPVEQFVMPRYGAACTLWPLFSALTHPGQVFRVPLAQLGRSRTHFDCFAVAEPRSAARYNTPPLLEASMLLIPGNPDEKADPLEVGSTCGVCPKAGCPGRREPSILAEGI